jgi:uncharacterized protein YndB with AHSA1/START domain
MAQNTTEVDAPCDAVFAVLTDARSYEQWVVGCKEIRAVDDRWPSPGSAFHHRVGLGPLNVADRTEVITIEPPRLLVLRARARPIGQARVTFELTGAAGGCQIVMTEEPLDARTKRYWNPVLDKLTSLRNVETLRRLKNLAEERATMAA